MENQHHKCPSGKLWHCNPPKSDAQPNNQPQQSIVATSYATSNGRTDTIRCAVTNGRCLANSLMKCSNASTVFEQRVASMGADSKVKFRKTVGGLPGHSACNSCRPESGPTTWAGGNLTCKFWQNKCPLSFRLWFGLAQQNAESAWETSTRPRGQAELWHVKLACRKSR
jgi:hypothetical protein